MSPFTPSIRTILTALIQHKTEQRGDFTRPQTLKVDTHDVAQCFFHLMGQYQLDLDLKQSLWRIQEMIDHTTS